MTGIIKKTSDTNLNLRQIYNFSLIELLVVIAIVAILAGMLLPALLKARQVAQQSSCLNNLKQHGVGVFAYINDFSDWMPCSDNNTGPGPGEWRLNILPYLKSNVLNSEIGTGVFICPSWLHPTITDNRFKGGYGWSTSGGLGDPNKGCGYKDSISGRGRVKLTSLRDPSKTIYAGEASDVGPDSMPHTYAQVYHPTFTMGSIPPVGTRHRQGVNMNWGDGHTEWKSRRDLSNGIAGDADWYYKRQKN